MAPQWRPGLKWKATKSGWRQQPLGSNIMASWHPKHGEHAMYSRYQAVDYRYINTSIHECIKYIYIYMYMMILMIYIYIYMYVRYTYIHVSLSLSVYIYIMYIIFSSIIIFSMQASSTAMFCAQVPKPKSIMDRYGPGRGNVRDTKRY